jgi:hypothetical protein
MRAPLSQRPNQHTIHTATVKVGLLVAVCLLFLVTSVSGHEFRGKSRIASFRLAR